MNMAYCRFQNTVGDFEDCLGAIEEMIEARASGMGRAEADANEVERVDDLSPEEAAAALRLFERACDFCNTVDNGLTAALRERSHG